VKTRAGPAAQENARGRPGKTNKKWAFHDARWIMKTGKYRSSCRLTFMPRQEGKKDGKQKLPPAPSKKTSPPSPPPHACIHSLFVKPVNAAQINSGGQEEYVRGTNKRYSLLEPFAPNLTGVAGYPSKAGKKPSRRRLSPGVAVLLAVPERGHVAFRGRLGQVGHPVVVHPKRRVVVQ